jgi:hypothetical protein
MTERMLRVSFAAAVGFGTLLVLAGPVTAGDVKLLKQPNSFPLIISQPGSYRLKSNIVVPDAATTAIQLDADGVTIDLNGYSISGPTVCSGTPVTSCAPSGGGSGIVGGSGGRDVTIVNGTVRGMGNDGISVAERARIEKVRLVSNGNNGIVANGNAIIDDVVTQQNGNDGISLGTSSVVTHNTAFGNAGTGVNLADWCVVTGNTANFNGYAGVSCINSCSLTGNVVHQNGGSPAIGSGTGLDTNGNSAVIGNVATNNAVAGLAIGSTSGYGNNVVNGNNGGNAFQQVFGGSQIGTNVCGADTTCP